MLNLTATDGNPVSTQTDPATVTLLLFVQGGQEQTEKACREIDRVIGEALLDGVRARWMLILSRSSDPEAVPALVEPLEHKPIVVRDADRGAFAAYNVIALPTVVVLDSDHQFVHRVPGLVPQFGEVVRLSLLMAEGKAEPADIERAQNPPPPVTDEARDKARQVELLARKAAQRGLDDLAVTQYERAIELDPTFDQPRLELGHLLVSLHRLDEAEAAFQGLLVLHPDSVGASLGRAAVLVARGGEHLDEAQTIAEGVLHANPRHARALFVLGQVHQARGETEDAMHCFRKSAEALFDATGAAAGTP